MAKPHLSAIVTFHKEGLLAHTALRSYALSRAVAGQAGLHVQLVLVLDNADVTTSSYVKNHFCLDGSECVVVTNVADLALARNVGVANATADYVCTLDGDDLISREYFARHLQEAGRREGRFILHPELVLSFGMYNAFNWQPDQEGPYYDPRSMLSVNPWISAAFSTRKVFEEIPYVACYPSSTGFGYEDWYWNCETIARGVVHGIAPHSAYFYRRKVSGSLNQASHAMKTVVPKTVFFEPGAVEGGA
ncbi:glycosyltransferase [Stenotrophomonas sp. AR029]|uniref:glycosyltransferase n=1 Tax=Stenotrophomonas sp. AR029 TaxID=3398601 RepID=UPI0039C6BFCE